MHEWLVDKDGDLWHLTGPGLYRCVTQDTETLAYRELAEHFGPLVEAVWTVRAAE